MILEGPLRDNLYYSRVAVPETGGKEELRGEAVALAEEYAVGAVRLALISAGINPDSGTWSVTESQDSNLERNSIIAEWRAK